MILVITSKGDAHVHAVTQHLDRAGHEWVRINTEDFATNIELTVHPGSGMGKIHVQDSGKRVNLEEIRSVWFRKPSSPTTSHFALDVPALEYVEAELNEILLGLYGLLGHAFWINDPFKTRIAHRKMVQLHVASHVGLPIPRTIITNEIDTALEFADQIGSDLAVKSLGAITVTQQAGNQATQYGLFTRRISSGELRSVVDKVPYQPTMFQEFVEKRCELRITFVGRQAFACRIENRIDDITAEDYRFDTTTLNHAPCDCPIELHRRLREYMDRLGLRFACFDVGIRQDGTPVFFEANPNGQWLWVEKMTRLPIGRAIAEELMARVHVE